MPPSLEDLMPQILQSLFPFERKLWGFLIRKTAGGKSPPKYARSLPGYGPVGAMYLLLASAWQLPGIVTGLTGAFVQIGGQLSRLLEVDERNS